MGAYSHGVRMDAYIREERVRTEMGTYIHGCLYSWGAYYPDYTVCWECTGSVHWQYAGCVLAVCWKCVGSMMRWQYAGSALGVHWEYTGRALGVHWEYTGRAL